MLKEDQSVIVYTAKITGRVLDCLTLSVFQPEMTLSMFLAIWSHPSRDYPHAHLSTNPEHLPVLMEREGISVVRIEEGWIATSRVASLTPDEKSKEGHVVYEDDGAVFAEDLQVAVCRCIVLKHRGAAVDVDPRLLVGL